MQFASIVAAAGIGLGCCNAAIGQAEQANWQWKRSRCANCRPASRCCSASAWARTMAASPTAARPSTVGDVVAADSPPQRRFALGLVNGDTALIAVEQGGRGYWWQTLEFKQAGTTWDAGALRLHRHVVPHRGNELLEAFAAHPAHNPLACRLPGAVVGRRRAGRAER